MIEDKIIRWAENKSEYDDDDQKKSTAPAGAIQKAGSVKPVLPKNTDKHSFEALCSNCGKRTETKFKPDDRRPVYCPECLQKAKKGELPLVPYNGDKDIPKEISLTFSD